MIVEAKTHAPGSIFDANGVELMYVTWADTESGEAVHLVREGDRCDQFLYTRDDSGREVVATVRKQHPAPLTYVRR